MKEVELKDMIKRGLETVTVIKSIRHPVNPLEIEMLETVNDVLLHSASILSDVQEMVRAKASPEKINEEINEAKFFIFNVMKYLSENPICPIKEICPFYHKAKQTGLVK